MRWANRPVGAFAIDCGGGLGLGGAGLGALQVLVAERATCVGEVLGPPAGGEEAAGKVCNTAT
jgi:hypothetical protein